MLDSIFSSAKSELLGQLSSKFNLTPDQAGKTVDVAKKTVTDGLVNEVTSGNVDGVMNLLNGKAPVTGNPIVNGMGQQFITSLVQKVGLNQQMATTIGNFVLPFIMSKLSGSKPGGGGFSANDITSMLGGGVGDKIKSALGGEGGIGGALGNMFGK